MLSIKNPNPSFAFEPLKRLTRPSSSSPVALCFSPSLRLSPPSYRLSRAAPKGSVVGFRRSVVVFAASHEESKHSENDEMKIESEEEEEEEEEANEAWKQALASFKEQALKMQSVSLEAYEIHSKQALITLKETSELLKIQAEKAKDDLTVIVKEISEDGKDYLSTAAENSPPEVKEIVETYSSSAEDFNDVSKVLDFHVGIPYGFFLSVGGFLSFMLTGSISAIRFGIVLGGALLALSVSSLKAHKRGEAFPLATKGQAAISSVLFLRELTILFRRPNLGSFLATLISGAVVAFYIYKLVSKNEPRLEPGTEN